MPIWVWPGQSWSKCRPTAPRWINPFWWANYGSNSLEQMALVCMWFCASLAEVCTLHGRACCIPRSFALSILQKMLHTGGHVNKTLRTIIWAISFSIISEHWVSELRVQSKYFICERSKPGCTLHYNNRSTWVRYLIKLRPDIWQSLDFHPIVVQPHFRH